MAKWHLRRLILVDLCIPLNESIFSHDLLGPLQTDCPLRLLLYISRCSWLASPLVGVPPRTCDSNHYFSQYLILSFLYSESSGNSREYHLDRYRCWLLWYLRAARLGDVAYQFWGQWDGRWPLAPNCGLLGSPPPFAAEQTWIHILSQLSAMDSVKAFINSYLRRSRASSSCVFPLRQDCFPNLVLLCVGTLVQVLVHNHRLPLGPLLCDLFDKGSSSLNSFVHCMRCIHF